jgi:hypothetical protein
MDGLLDFPALARPMTQEKTRPPARGPRTPSSTMNQSITPPTANPRQVADFDRHQSWRGSEAKSTLWGAVVSR